MAASTSPVGRSQHHTRPTLRPITPISAATRACAQEADAAMTWDNWEYSPPSVLPEPLRFADPKPLLQ